MSGTEVLPQFSLKQLHEVTRKTRKLPLHLKTKNLLSNSASLCLADEGGLRRGLDASPISLEVSGATHRGFSSRHEISL